MTKKIARRSSPGAPERRPNEAVKLLEVNPRRRISA